MPYLKIGTEVWLNNEINDKTVFIVYASKETPYNHPVRGELYPIKKFDYLIVERDFDHKAESMPLIEVFQNEITPVPFDSF